MNTARVDELFGRALEHDEHERDAFLDSACGDDDALREEVESLVRAHATMGGFMGGTAAGVLGACVPRLKSGAEVGDYRVVRRIAEGGSGAVYEAIQASPERRVALKVMRAGPASARQMSRFAREAQILARLNHPAVAAVYEAGVEETDEGALSWFALEYVEGSTTLLDHAHEKKLATADRLALFARVCDAVHHGHQQGLLHRDIKPGNILVDGDGRPKVIDFGIACAVEDAAATEIAGTPPYMSPEQTTGGHLDVRSDVYSLGVVLDELLSSEGSPPPTDVRSIVRKARAGDPEERYGSASALGEDVRRHLTREPVLAHPGGPLYRLGKFARRQRLAFGAILAIVVVSLAAAVVSTRLALQQSSARRNAEFQSYVANVAAASAALRIGDVTESRRRLEDAPAHLRGWEWRHLSRRVDMSTRTLAWPEARIWTGALSPDGSLLAAIGLDRRDPEEYAIRIWDRPLGRVLLTIPVAARVQSLAFSGDGALLALGYDSGRIEVRDVHRGAPRHRFEGHADEVNAMVFDARGERMVSVGRDRTVRVWSLRVGTPPRILRGHEDRVICVCLSPDGRQALTGGREGDLRVWDLEDGTVRVVKAHRSSIEGVDWSRDGSFFVSACRDGTVGVWDATSLRRTATLRGHADVARDIAISPDGRLLATASYDRTVRLWDVTSGLERACLRGHGQSVVRVAFTPDGRRVVSASRGGTLKEWPVAARDPVPTLRGHADAILAVACAPTGRTVVTGSADGSVRLWDGITGRPKRTLHDGEHAARTLVHGPARLHAGFSSGRVMTWSLPDGVLRWETNRSTAIAALADGSRLFSATTKGEIVVHAAATGAVLLRWSPQIGAIMAVAVSRGGDRVVTMTASGEIAVSDARGGRVAVRRNDAWQVALAVSPDDTTVAVGDYEGNIALYDLETLEERGVLTGHTRVSCTGQTAAVWPRAGGTARSGCGTPRGVGPWSFSRGTAIRSTPSP